MAEEKPFDCKELRGKRERLGMSRKELADATGMFKGGERLIKEWEDGKSVPPKEQLQKLMGFPEEPPFPNRKDADYRMIDLFAGIGGTRLGFWQTGRVNSLFTSEIDKNAQKTYKANFGDIPCGDIKAINATDIPDHDILVGGFPCQAFSQAGLKRGFNDTRGTLFFEIARILKEKRPKAFLLENVRNLVSHDHGNTFRVIMSTLDELGYATTPMLFHARDFGVPQNRERIYIAGFNREMVPNCGEFTPPIPPKTPTRLGDILEPTKNPKYTLSDKLWEGTLHRKEEHIKKGNGFGYKIFNAESPYTSTLSARYYKDGSEILVEQEGRNPRKLTPRECARLQGFPEEFIIPVSDMQAYKQFGNSVAVPVIHAIAEQMLKVLDDCLVK